MSELYNWYWGRIEDGWQLYSASSEEVADHQAEQSSDGNRHGEFYGIWQQTTEGQPMILIRIWHMGESCEIPH